jgi:alpha-1,6-mannosyltransferase
MVIGDGPARRSVERLVAGAPGARLMAPVTDRVRLAAIYASADLLVHGSGAETYGLVVAEALSSGLAVVAPDTGGAADLARRGRSVTYRTGDPQSCALAIAAALDGRAVAQAPARPTTAESHFVELFALYGRLLDEKARGAAKAA